MEKNMAENKINKDMTFGELLKKFPQAGPIIASYGLHCIGCHIAVDETIEQGTAAHGIDANTLNKMILELNEKAL
jgi:hybrid cluster-associated redox disulfide protein